MGISRLGRAAACTIGVSLALLASSPVAASADQWGRPVATGRSLAPGTRFFVPAPAKGSFAQIVSLLRSGDRKDAMLLAAMEATPQAVWFTGTNPSGSEQTPDQVAWAVRRTLLEARSEQAVPVMVIYNIPGRDCAQYSSGGAPTDAAYQAWVSGFAHGLGDAKAVVLVEPDALANLPSDCGAGAYAGEANPPTDASRLADINFDVTTLEADPNASVYLDGGNSAWQSVGSSTPTSGQTPPAPFADIPGMAERLAAAGVAKAQGFFLDVSNYQYTQNSVYYGTWVSDCLAIAAGNGGSYKNCPGQYWNGGPSGTEIANLLGAWNGVALDRYGVWSDTTVTPDLNVSGIDAQYATSLGSAVPTTHFVVDTSRNGQGPNDMSAYGTGTAYNQPSSVIGTLQSGNWCNPPGAGLGVRPSADTSSVSPLLDAYLWVKTPGQSDGQCDAAGGVRAWDDSSSTPSITGWPAPSSSTFSQFDPLWSIQTGSVLTDPAAGTWFPQQALQLAQLANPPLSPSLPLFGHH